MSVLLKPQHLSAFDRFLDMIEMILVPLSVIAFVLGIFIASGSPEIAASVSGGMDSFIDLYSLFAPVVIFLVLTPSLIRIFQDVKTGKAFAQYSIIWFAKARILACLYAVVVTTIVFGLPLYDQTEGAGAALLRSVISLGEMLVSSYYFYAVYASLLTVWIALRYAPLARFLSGGVTLIESVGRMLIPLVPLMMFAVGAYVTVLPEVIGESVGSDGGSARAVSFLGFDVGVDNAYGIFLVYVLAAVLTGVVCGFWHIGLLRIARSRIVGFSIRDYFVNYWMKVYPLLWATSSEALATPLNLYMIKKRYPDLKEEVVSFVVGAGSFMNINGTVINVFLMTGLVAGLAGVEISMLHLLICVPIVFLIAYGIPGIPGELLIFAGPIMFCLGVPTELEPLFLTLYIGLQIGLPDSFRTGANSTDDCLSAIILNSHYGEKGSDPA